VYLDPVQPPIHPNYESFQEYKSQSLFHEKQFDVKNNSNNGATNNEEEDLNNKSFVDVSF